MNTTNTGVEKIVDPLCVIFSPTRKVQRTLYPLAFPHNEASLVELGRRHLYWLPVEEYLLYAICSATVQLVPVRSLRIYEAIKPADVDVHQDRINELVADLTQFAANEQPWLRRGMLGNKCLETKITRDMGLAIPQFISETYGIECDMLIFARWACLQYALYLASCTAHEFKLYSNKIEFRQNSDIRVGWLKVLRHELGLISKRKFARSTQYLNPYGPEPTSLQEWLDWRDNPPPLTAEMITQSSAWRAEKMYQEARARLSELLEQEPLQEKDRYPFRYHSEANELNNLVATKLIPFPRLR